MRMIAETVALHADIIWPSCAGSRIATARAVILGNERFKVLAEQVDRRVREAGRLCRDHRPPNAAQQEESNPATGERPTHNSTPAHKVSSAASERLHPEQTPPASAKAGRRGPGYSQHAKVTADRTEPALDRRPKPATRKIPIRIIKGEVRGFARKAAVKMAANLLSFLPFAAGYYLAYLFRTINAAISPHWPRFCARCAETGLLASIYFLVFGLTRFQ